MFPPIPSSIPDHLTSAQLENLCSSQHPNHICLFTLNGEPYFWTAWCKICSRRPDYATDQPPVGIDPEYFRLTQEWAKETFADQEEKRRLLREKREQRRREHTAKR